MKSTLHERIRPNMVSIVMYATRKIYNKKTKSRNVSRAACTFAPGYSPAFRSLCFSSVAWPITMRANNNNRRNAAGKIEVHRIYENML